MKYLLEQTTVNEVSYMPGRFPTPELAQQFHPRTQATFKVLPESEIAKQYEIWSIELTTGIVSLIDSWYPLYCARTIASRFNNHQAEKHYWIQPLGADRPAWIMQYQAYMHGLFDIAIESKLMTVSNRWELTKRLAVVLTFTDAYMVTKQCVWFCLDHEVGEHTKRVMHELPDFNHLNVSSVGDTTFHFIDDTEAHLRFLSLDKFLGVFMG